MRRNYRNYTRLVKQKVQSFFDISTTTDGYQILQFNAGGNDLIRRMPGMFGTFKYFKLGNIKVTAVPASTLPVDPTGLSYEQGENTVDPRDQLTPGLIRITNGEDMRGFTDGSVLTSDDEYNAMMLDPRWFKFMLQSGFKRSCTPKFWGIGMLNQFYAPGSVVNVPVADETLLGQFRADSLITTPTGSSSQNLNNLSPIGSNDLSNGIFQTGQKIRMGWLPTDAINRNQKISTNQGMINSVPECQCITVILPKQRKTRYYYRVFCTETIYFRDPVVVSPVASDTYLSALPVDYQNKLTLSGAGLFDSLGSAADVVEYETLLQNDGNKGGVN